MLVEQVDLLAKGLFELAAQFKVNVA